MHLRIYILVLVGLLVSCAKDQERKPWPAYIGTYNGMSEEEKLEVRKVVEELNTRAESTVISLDTAPEGYSIAMNKNAPEQDVKDRAGYAVVGPESCNIDLSSILFHPNMKEYIRPVIFHELGHCAGLEHSPTQGDIMYSVNVRSSEYPEEAITKFIAEFRAAAGI